MATFIAQDCATRVPVPAAFFSRGPCAHSVTAWSDALPRPTLADILDVLAPPRRGSVRNRPKRGGGRA
jgi:hypothetical protein